MTLWYEISSFFVNLVLPMIVGWLLVHRFGVPQRWLDRLMPAGILVATPVLTCMTFWGVALEPRLAWLPVIGIVMLAIPMGAAFVTVRAKHDYTALDRGTYVIASMLANRGVVGGLTVYTLFGEPGYAWSQMVVIFGPAVVFMVAFPLAGWYRRRETGDTAVRGSFWSLIFSRNQMPVLGLLAGLTLNLAGMPRPEPIAASVPAVVTAVAWLFLLPTGGTLDFREMARYGRGLMDMLAIKFLVTPAVLAIILWALGFSGDLFWAMIVLAASPTAIFTVIVARLQRLNLHLAMASYVLTHLVYFVVILPVALVALLLLR